MQERVSLVNGQWEIQSAPGQGTTISVTIPLEQDLISVLPEPQTLSRSTETVSLVTHSQGEDHARSAD